MFTDDFYKDLTVNPDLLDRMDTSDLPKNHPCHLDVRKKIPGYFSDETHGRIMFEFVALRAKLYAYDMEGTKIIKAKGIRKPVVRNHLTLLDYKQCLFENDDDGDGSDDDDEETKKSTAHECARTVVRNIHRNGATGQNMPPPPYTPPTPYRINVSFRSYGHQIKTIKTVKNALNRLDDKRVVQRDRIHTLAHGHYKLYKD